MKLFYKVDNCEVEVFNFYEDRTVLIFSPAAAARQNGNGWIKCSLKHLVPIEYYNEHCLDGEFISTTQKNKYKKRIKLDYAEWRCFDGSVHTDINDAILHEKELEAKTESSF